MDLKTWISPYQLRARTTLGGLAGAPVRHGALIRTEWPNGAAGYADLHPWPELGDAPLDRQIESLRVREELPLAKRSRLMTITDTSARCGERSLIDERTTLLNHWLVPDVTRLDDPTMDEIVSRQFTHLKVKIGTDLTAEMDAIARLDVDLGERIRWRLDANARLSAPALTDGLERLRNRVGEERWPELIDFVEDPCPFDREQWGGLIARLGINLAVDRELRAVEFPDCWTHLVCRPVVAPPSHHPGLRDKEYRLVFTSYLDHPVGQMHAAAFVTQNAREFGTRLDVCGLLSHPVYEPTPYSEAIRTDGPVLLPPDGPGIGFGDLLERENWRRLV